VLSADEVERQGAILRLVEQRHLSTQAEVADALRDEGIDAVQATVSRDIAQLGLVKVRNGDGRSSTRCRARPTSPARRARVRAAPLGRGMTPPGQLLVITTPRASRAARRRDRRGALADVAGTIAGENTIFVAARDG
jgi:transcriptional regulator of arginine metabolism